MEGLNSENYFRISLTELLYIIWYTYNSETLISTITVLQNEYSNKFAYNVGVSYNLHICVHTPSGYYPSNAGRYEFKMFRIYFTESHSYSLSIWIDIIK